MAKSGMVIHQATGGATLNELVTPPKSGDSAFILSIKLHFDTAPTTSENFTVAVDSATAAVHDVNLLTQDMATNADLLQTYDGQDGLPIAAGDKLQIDYPNTDTRTWALEVNYRQGV